MAAPYPSTGALLWAPDLKKYVDERVLSVNVKNYGAVGDGITDDATAIQSACDAAAAVTGARVVGQGTFLIGSTVSIACDADFTGATFNYTGTGVAVSVGTSVSAAVINRKVVSLPDIVFTNKPGTGWTASTIGLRLINLFSSEVHVGRVSGFEDGMMLFGLGTGTVYNTITLRHLDNNKRNIRFSADSTGWANQNTIVGGRCSHNSAEGTQVTGTRHVLMDNTTNIVNNNVFVGTSLESPNVVEYHVESFGWDCSWVGCRWENTTTANTRVSWRAGSRGNLVQFGFGAQNIVEVVEGGNSNTLNSVLSKYGQRLFGSGTAGNLAGLLLENNTSNASPVARVLPAGAYSASSDPTTAYTWEWTANSLTAKRTGDATGAPRLVLDGSNGTVRVMQAVTGSRPSAATVGAGAMFYDTTLAKPIWSTGSVWKDAAGTTV